MISEVYPRQRTLGVYRYGDELLYDVQKDSATILALTPHDGGQTVAAEPAYDRTGPGRASEPCVLGRRL